LATTYSLRRGETRPYDSYRRHRLLKRGLVEPPHAQFQSSPPWQYHPGVSTTYYQWLAFRRPVGPSRGGRSRRAGAVVAASLLMLVAAVASTASAGAGVLAAGDEKLSSGEYFDRVSFSGAAGDEVL